MPVQTRSRKDYSTGTSTVRSGCPKTAVRTRRKKIIVNHPVLPLDEPALPLEEPALPLEEPTLPCTIADINNIDSVVDLEDNFLLWDIDPDELDNFKVFERKITDLGDFMRKWARANISRQVGSTLFAKYLRLFFRRFVETEGFAQPKNINTSLGNKLMFLFHIGKADHNGVTDRQPRYRGIGLRDEAARKRFEKITRLPRNCIEY